MVTVGVDAAMMGGARSAQSYLLFEPRYCCLEEQEQLSQVMGRKLWLRKNLPKWTHGR